jgi:threonine-phosphate decarboxylase
VERLLKELNECDLVFLCNPNNPTGRLETRSDLAKIITAARATGTMVVIDEAFMDFIPDREDYTLVRQAGQPGGPVVLYSLTKFFGIPGLRLGAVVAPPELAGRLERTRDPWSVNTMAQVAGLVALGEKAYMEETRALVERERCFLKEELARLPGVAVFPGTANYLLLDIRGTGLDAGTLTEKMCRLGILVRDCSSFSGLGDGFIRVAVRLRFENRRLLAGLQSIMGGISK